jgi:hypothetical protein
MATLPSVRGWPRPRGMQGLQNRTGMQQPSVRIRGPRQSLHRATRCLSGPYGQPSRCRFLPIDRRAVSSSAWIALRRWYQRQPHCPISRAACQGLHTLRSRCPYGQQRLRRCRPWRQLGRHLWLPRRPAPPEATCDFFAVVVAPLHHWCYGVLVQRFTIAVSSEVHVALRLEAAHRGVSMSALAARFVEEGLGLGVGERRPAPVDGTSADGPDVPVSSSVDEAGEGPVSKVLKGR